MSTDLSKITDSRSQPPDAPLSALSVATQTTLMETVRKLTGVELSFGAGLVTFVLNEATFRKPVAQMTVYGAFRTAARMMDFAMKRRPAADGYRY